MNLIFTQSGEKIEKNAFDFNEKLISFKILIRVSLARNDARSN